MNQTRETYGHLFLIMGILLALVLLLISAFIGQKTWAHQTELTRNFEALWNVRHSKQLWTPQSRKNFSLLKRCKSLVRRVAAEHIPTKTSRHR